MTTERLNGKEPAEGTTKKKSRILTTKQIYDIETQWEKWWGEYRSTGITPTAPELEEMRPYYEQFVGTIREFEASPEGVQFKQQMSDVQKLSPFKTAEGFYNIDEARKAGIDEALLSRVFGENLPQPTPVQPQVRAPAKEERYEVPSVIGGFNLQQALQKAYPEMYRTTKYDESGKVIEYGTSYGYSLEELYPMNLENLMRRAQEDFTSFHEDLINRVGESEATKILQAMGVSEDVVLGSLDAMRQEERVINSIKAVFPALDSIEEFSSFLAEDPEKFFEQIQTFTTGSASSVERRQLLEQMGFSPEDINSILNKRIIMADVDGIRQRITLDVANQAAYNEVGNYIGKYNWATKEFTKAPDKNIFQNFWDWTMFSARAQWENTENFFLSVLPEIVYTEMPEGYLGGLGEFMNETNRDMRERFRYMYQANKAEYDKWVKANPEIAPSAEYQAGAFQNADLLKDPNYYAYELANLVPFLVTSIAVTIATGGVGATSVLGIAAIQAPSEAQSVYEDLLAAGAPQEKASDMALVAGSLIGLLESAGRIPLLKNISNSTFALFKKEAVNNMVKMTVPQLIAKFGRDFTMSEFAESLTEVAQEAIANAAVGVYDENRSIFDNLPDIFVKTMVGNMLPALIGAGGGATVSMISESRLENTTRAQRLANGWIEDHKGNWYEVVPEETVTAKVAEENIGFANLQEEYVNLVSQANIVASENPTVVKAVEIVNSMTAENQRESLIKIEALEDDLRAIVAQAPKITEFRYTTAEAWDNALIEDRVALAKAVGLEGKVGSKSAIELTTDERVTLSRGITAPEITEERATGEAMRPSTSVQTGLKGFGREEAQAKMFEEVSGKESRLVPFTEIPSRPEMKEGQIHLEKVQQDKVERLKQRHEVELQEASDELTEIEAIKAFLEMDPVATYRIKEQVNRQVRQPDGSTIMVQNARWIGLDRFISIREGSFPNYLTVKVAQKINPHHDWSYYTQKGTKQYNHIPRENVLDSLSQELGYDYAGGIDEMVEKIEQIRSSKRRLAELSSKVATIPITPAEVTKTLDQIEEEPELAPSNALPPTTPPSVGIPLDTNPDPLMPDPAQSNVIGLRPIAAGLTRSEIAGNFLKRIVNKIGSFTGIGQMVEAAPLANGAMRERARVMVTVDSQANSIGARWAASINKAFIFDDMGRIPALTGVDPSIPIAPTIQDVAARFPQFVAALDSDQMNLLAELKEVLKPYRILLEEQGIEVPFRADIVEGGFYIPRGKASLEGDQPFRVRGRGAGVKKGFERPAFFDSMAEGIEAGYEYRDIGDVITNYIYDAGVRATNTYIANYFKTLNDETGRLMGETVKMRMLRQNPQIYQEYMDVNKELNRLKRNIGALTERQMDVIEMWQNDHEFGDIDALLDGLETMVGGRERVTLPELREFYQATREKLKALRPEWKKAMRRAQATPVDQGVIILPELAGRTYPNEIANAVNVILKREGETVGRLSPVLNIVNVYNNLYRGIRATLDDSVVGIQGLLGMYGDSRAYAGAFRLHMLSWANEDALGAWVKDFDESRLAAGRITTSEMAKYGLHFAGKEGTEFSLGAGQRIGEMWGVKQANRAFANFGDVLRCIWVDHNIETQLRKGRSLEQLRLSGDIDRICNVANGMTGWSTKKAFGSLGELILFAPRFLQSRFETVTRAAMGLSPNATLDQQIARNALIKMIAFGTVLTVFANAMQGEDTDFRPLVQDPDGQWRRNARFMRIKMGGHYYSVFGTWDSLLGLFLNIGTGRFDLAMRSMSSGIVANAWDLITGRDYNYNAITESPHEFGKWIISNFIPFGISQAGSGFKQMWGGAMEGDVEDLLQGAINVSAEIFGVKSYPAEDWDANFERLGLFMYEDDVNVSVEIPRYTWSMFVSDTAAKIRRTPLEEVETSKDYPIQVQAVAHTLILKDQYNDIRNWSLISIDGDKLSDYYDWWREREKLVAAGDKAKYTVVGELQPDGKRKDVTYKGEDAVKAFDKQHEGVKYGNITHAQYVLLKEYWALNNDELKEEFVELHPELAENLRYKKLLSNPEDNAYLALAGLAPVLTKEAYNKLRNLMVELDIPETGVDPLALPPKSSLDTHFKYQEMVSEGSYNSAEAKLLLLQDYLDAKKNGVISYCDWRTENNQPLQVPEEQLEYYQLLVDNKSLFDRLQEIADSNMTDEQKKREREKLRATAVGDQTFADIERRVEVMAKGSREEPIDPALIDAYIGHMRIVDDSSGNSAKAKLNRYDNPTLNEFLMDKDIWGTSAAQPLDIDKDYLDNYLVPKWRIQVNEDFIKKDEEYNKIDPDARNPKTGQSLREEYLFDPENSDYRTWRRKIEAYELRNPVTGERLPVDLINSYITYYEIPQKGYRNERFIVNNPRFAEAMFRITGSDIWKTRAEDVPDQRYDDIYDEWIDTFELIDDFSDINSPVYKDNTIKAADGLTDRQRAVNDLMFNEVVQSYSGVQAKNLSATAFALAVWEREAYKLFVPDRYVYTYVMWKKLQAEGKPARWSELSGTDMWYEDDWFMMENIDYYRDVYLGDLDKDGKPDHERLDFTKVPSRDVFRKYLTYVDLPHQTAKDEYRLANLDLDAWGVAKFGWKPIEDKIAESKRRAELTPYERLLEDYWGRQQTIEEKIAELLNR